MHDKNRQDYFVGLVKWVKNNYEKETHKEMILKWVPGKQIALRLNQYYNSTVSMSMSSQSEKPKSLVLAQPKKLFL